MDTTVSIGVREFNFILIDNLAGIHHSRNPPLFSFHSKGAITSSGISTVISIIPLTMLRFYI